MAKQQKGELVILGFDYSPMETNVAEQARSIADRIRERLKKTLEDLIAVGSDLLAVKESSSSRPIPAVDQGRVRLVGADGPKLHECG